MILRDYQETMLDEARSHMRAKRRRVLVVAPTGAGKRIIACCTIAAAVERGKRCTMLVHRQELLDQSSDTLREAGVPHGIIKAGVRPEPWHAAQIGSMQSVARRLTTLEPPDFVFHDESHHVAGDTWAKICATWPGAFSLGFTATPVRLDGKGLGKFFDAMVIGPSMRELIDQGYLADYRLFAPPAQNLDKVRTVAGEFDKAQLVAAIDRPEIVGDVVAHYQRCAAGKQAVCFGVNVLHSKHMAEAFCRAGIPARHVDGETPKDERRQILADFVARGFRVLCNCEILSEGLDVAGIEAVICARPTRSLTVYLQQIGRGMRVKPSGEPAVILDHAGNCRRLGLPDDEREWELTEDRIRRTKATIEIKTCPACFMVIPGDSMVCPGCGTVLRKERRVRETKGELVEIDSVERRQRQEADRQRRQWFALVNAARKRGIGNPEAWARKILERQRRAG